MKIIFLSFFMFVSFLQAQTEASNNRKPIVVLPDILIKNDTLLLLQTTIKALLLQLVVKLLHIILKICKNTNII